MSWRAGVAVAAVATTACTGPTADGRTEATTTTSAPPVPVVPAEPSAQILRERRLLADPAPLPSIQQRLGVAPVIMPPDAYRFDALGTSVTLELGEYWRLDSEHPGKFVLTRPDAELEVLLPAVVFARPVGFAHPRRAATDSVYPGSSGWERGDLGTWIEAMDQIVVVDSGRTDVDGTPARWWDVDVDPERGRTLTGCQPGTCVAMFWTGGTETFTVARDLERLRWYEIDDPLGPIVVLVAATDGDFPQLVDDVAGLLRSATLGPPEPHPVEAGVATASFMELAANTRWRFAGLPGVVYESVTATTVDQRRGGIRFLAYDGGDIELLRPLTDAFGRRLDDADAVVDAIVGHPGSTIRDDTSRLLGRPATEIELVHAPGDDAVVRLVDVPDGFDPTDASWPEQRHHRIWVLDDPLGPLVVGASSETATGLDRALDRLDSALDGVVLCATDSCDDER